MTIDRRSFIKLASAGAAGAGASALPFGAAAAEAKTTKRVVVVGAGFGGTIAAKYIRMMDPTIEVVLIERNKEIVSCPFSNLVLGGERKMSDLTRKYDKLVANHKIKMVNAEVTAIDAAKKEVVTSGGTFAYDRLVLSPGIDFRFEELEGYDPATTPEIMPHAWKAGPQTVLLRKQLEAMKDGGTVVLSIPLTPYRCPPGPYERTSMIAWYLKNNKPKSKIIVLDANPDITSKAGLFKKGWTKHYGFGTPDSIIDYRGAKKVTAVNPKTMSVMVEGIEEVKGDVVNVIPPQRAGAIAVKTGLVGADKNWCPVNPNTFESTLVPGVHVIGDACVAGAMPKSGYSANSQAKVCATNIVALLNGRETTDLSGINVCYSYITAKEAVSVAFVYKVAKDEKDGVTKIVPASKPPGVSPDLSELEGTYADSWLRNILGEMSS